MTITMKQAAEIAARNHLRLEDAVALRQASTVEEAQEIASAYTAPVQLSRGDLASLTPDQIEAARVGHQLDDLLNGKVDE